MTRVAWFRLHSPARRELIMSFVPRSNYITHEHCIRSDVMVRSRRVQTKDWILVGEVARARGAKNCMQYEVYRRLGVKRKEVNAKRRYKRKREETIS